MHGLQELYSKERKEFRDEYNIMRTVIEALDLKVSARDIELAEERSLTNKLKAKVKSLGGPAKLKLFSFLNLY